jgi:uncharacterized protein YycO
MKRFMLTAVFLIMVPGYADLAVTKARAESQPPDDSAFQAARLQCDEHTRQHHHGLTHASRRAAMEAEIQDYLRLAEEALSMRAAAIQLYRELKTKTSRGQTPLSGQDLKSLNEGAAKLLAQRSALLKVAQLHECWIDQGDPRDEGDAGLRAAGIVMSLSAALILYDNYLSAIAPFRQDQEFRQHMNRSDHGFGIPAGTLNEIAINFASPENRRRTKRAIDWVERNAKSLKTEPFEQYGYLLRSIDQSPSLNMVRQVSAFRDIGAGLGFFSTLTVDTLFALKNESTNLSSLLFGNAIGLVEARRGKLDAQAPVATRVKQTLKAGDILVEKTPFRLTDTFIPGHWGHAAIWVGGESELRELGIWDHPVVRPHHEAVRAGQGVVEALRSGVQMNTIEHFLNVDDLAILRHPALDRDALVESLLQTFRQVGKAYDFNFDAETTHRVFCSKLVYLAYGDLKWPTSRVLGRVTVSPDNIAALAIGKGPLRLALLYHDGEEIADQPQAVMDRLMRAESAALARRETQRQSALALQEVE